MQKYKLMIPVTRKLNDQLYMYDNTTNHNIMKLNTLHKKTPYNQILYFRDKLSTPRSNPYHHLGNKINANEGS